MNNVKNNAYFYINYLLTRGRALNLYKIKHYINNNKIKDYEITSLNASVFS